MPRFNFNCAACGAFEDIVPNAESEARCPECGEVATRNFSPTRNILIPAWMRADSDGAHSAYFNSPEVQKGLKEGTMVLQSEYDSRSHEPA